MAPAEIDLGVVIATGLEFAISFDYESRPGVLRTVVVDTIYGDIPDKPEYFRGLDSLSGERRAFKTARLLLAGIHANPAVISYPDWYVGQLARVALGLPTHRPPQLFTPNRHVALEVQDHDGIVRPYQGILTEALYDYSWRGPHVDVVVTYLQNGRRRSLKARASGSGNDRRPIHSWTDLETREVVDEPLVWLERHSLP